MKNFKEIKHILHHPNGWLRLKPPTMRSGYANVVY
jgi:hypothetical protein